ncbi:MULTISPECIES: ABC transporter ATP-binding protein [Rhodococcus]|nr:MULTISPECIES: ABC transporter ATP-binding protein [Rhodococcus]WSE24187.1 ABC transporter ATP-binding protein [Rhodococcus sp. PD04]
MDTPRSMDIEPGGERPTDTLVDIENLTVRYGGPDSTPAIEGIDIRIDRGERVALVGESGSGKTTLAMAMAGFLVQPGIAITADRATFDGNPIPLRHLSRLPCRIPGMAMVVQDAMTSLDPVYSIGSQLCAVLRTAEKRPKAEIHDRAAEWLIKVGLNDTRRVMKAKPYELSGGMRQRVMMAIALASQPQLLLADEPTSALDASLARATMELLLELTESSDTSLLIVSHDLRLCLEYTDRICVMRHGAIVEEQPSSRIEHEARHPYTIGLLECVPTMATAGRDFLPTLEEVMAHAEQDVA